MIANNILLPITLTHSGNNVILDRQNDQIELLLYIYSRT